MKKILTICLGLLLMVPAFGKNDKQAPKWRYEIEAAVGQAANGAALVRVWSYSSKANLPEGLAAKNAIHGILFKGYPASTTGTRLAGREPMIADAAAEAAHQAYFDAFFANGGPYTRYVSTIGNGIPEPPIKVGKEYKIGLTLLVMVDQLRKRLEEDKIIAPLGSAGKLPTIMVVPSNAWCNNHDCMQAFDNQGATEYVADYDKALRTSSELKTAINTLNARMAKRGFPLKDLEAALKSLKSESAEEMMMMSQDGEAIAESPIDILRRTAKADIWIEIDWYTTEAKGGTQTTLTFSMNALDAYTDMSVAGVPPTTGRPAYTSTFQLPIQMEEIIFGQFDNFCNSLQAFFDNCASYGRAIKLRILTWDGFEDGLMAEFNGEELHEIIEDWLEANTVNGKFGSPDISPSGTRMTVEQVRIPLQNAKGRDIDARTWARDLQKMLRNKYGIESHLSAKGLGQVQLIIGGQ